MLDCRSVLAQYGEISIEIFQLITDQSRCTKFFYASVKTFYFACFYVVPDFIETKNVPKETDKDSL